MAAGGNAGPDGRGGAAAAARAAVSDGQSPVAGRGQTGNMGTNAIIERMPLPQLAPQASAAPRRNVAEVGTSRLDDAALIRAAQTGDRSAFEELVRHYD